MDNCSKQFSLLSPMTPHLPFTSPKGFALWKPQLLLERCLVARGVRSARIGQSHPSETQPLSRASVPAPLERVKPLHPSGARPSHRAVQDLRTEQCKTFAPSERDTLFRASRWALHGRAGGLCTSEQRVFARAGRGALLERAGWHSFRVIFLSR